MKKVIFSTIFLFSLSFVLLTDIFINRYDSFFKSIIKKYSYFDSFNFKKVSGNLISGFAVEDMNVSMNGFQFKFDDLIIKFKGFILIDYIKSDLGKIRFIETKKYPNENLIINQENNDYMNININELLVIKNKQSYKINFKVDVIERFGIAISNISVIGNFTQPNLLDAQIKISELELFQNFFPNINVSINYKDEAFHFNIPKNIDKSDQFVRANFKVRSPNIIINSAAIRFKNEDSLYVDNEQLYFSDIITGEDFKINYMNGWVDIDKFKLKDLQTYFVDMRFKNFDLKLFKGLKAKGKLSGDLYISNNNSAVFRNARIKNFSFEKINLDEIFAEGYIADDFYNISDINVKKKIGFIDVSSFYNKIIEEFNLKY